LAEQGTELTLEVCGPDQDRALSALAELIANMAQFEAEITEAEGNNGKDDG
jgi:phosphotransferase system HPr-like phosphotransfer protein